MIPNTSPAPPHEFSSRKEAEECAIAWLKKLQTHSSIAWEWEADDSMSCALAAGVPAMVVGGVTSPIDHKWRPSLWFTVGVKYEGRYWQGRVGEWDRPGVVSDEALAAFEVVLDVLRIAAQMRVSDPTTVSV